MEAMAEDQDMEAEETKVGVAMAVVVQEIMVAARTRVVTGAAVQALTTGAAPVLTTEAAVLTKATEVADRVLTTEAAAAMAVADTEDTVAGADVADMEEVMAGMVEVVETTETKTRTIPTNSKWHRITSSPLVHHHSRDPLRILPRRRSSNSKTTTHRSTTTNPLPLSNQVVAAALLNGITPIDPNFKTELVNPKSEKKPQHFKPILMVQKRKKLQKRKNIYVIHQMNY